MVLAAMLIPTKADAAWEGDDHMKLTPLIWQKSVTYNTKSGTLKACVSMVDNSNNTYTIDAYEDDGNLGLTKLGAVSMKGNACAYFYNVEADGDNGYAEVYFRLGNARYSDDLVKLDVYLQ